MMAVMPLVFFVDLGVLVGVPVYLFVAFRAKLVSENTIITNVVSMQECFDKYISNEIKLIKTKMFSAGREGLAFKYYGKYYANGEVIMAVDVIAVVFILQAVITFTILVSLIWKYKSC